MGAIIKLVLEIGLLFIKQYLTKKEKEEKYEYKKNLNTFKEAVAKGDVNIIAAEYERLRDKA